MPSYSPFICLIRPIASLLLEKYLDIKYVKTLPRIQYGTWETETGSVLLLSMTKVNLFILQGENGQTLFTGRDSETVFIG